MPLIGSIAERQTAMLTQDTSKEIGQEKGEDRDAKRISNDEYGRLSVARQ